MDTEMAGPISVQVIADFPKSGLWNVHGDFMVKHEYDNGISVLTSGGILMVRYEGSEGWIFVSRGAYVASSSDPVAKEKSKKALDASEPKILESKIGPNETHLYKVDDQHGNWLDCIQSRKDPISQLIWGIWHV